MLQHTISPTDLQVRMVAEERVRELERICKRLLRKGIVRTDPEHLDVQILEFAVVGLPGRHVLRSRYPEIADVELDKHQLLTAELAQADLLARRAGKREVRRLLSDFQGGGYADDTEHTGQ
jgi:hypothetical protein